jgi:hypothetical protein
LYANGDQIKENEMGGACSTHGEMPHVDKMLVGKPEILREDGKIILE